MRRRTARILPLKAGRPKGRPLPGIRGRIRGRKPTFARTGATMRALLGTLVLIGLILAPLSAASVDGLKLHSASAGTGNAIIFVHGWTCDSTSWAAQVPEFAKKYRVLTLDLPGHGQSAGPADGKFSVGLFARAVEAVRAEAGVDRVVLVGHSMGAPVIREYA